MILKQILKGVKGGRKQGSCTSCPFRGNIGGDTYGYCSAVNHIVWEVNKVQSIKDVETIVKNTSDEYIPVHRDTLLELLKSHRFLSELHKAGVDNWEYYWMAFREVNEEEE